MQDLAPQWGEKILDIGCGDGELGTFIMEQGATVLGIDSSAYFVVIWREAIGPDQT